MKQRPYPDQMYIDVPTMTKTVSAAVIALCIMSLIVSFATGFTLIERFFSVLFAFFASGFYLMASILKKKHGAPTNP